MATSGYKSIKRLMQRNQQDKQYEFATKQYSTRLRDTILRDTQRQLDKMSENPVDILISGALPNNELKGFTVANLPEIRVNENVSLVKKDGVQVAARGSVISAGADGVKVKLSRPLSVASDTPEDERVFRLKFEGKHIQLRRDRVESALRRFSSVSCSLPIHKSLLGNYNELFNTKHQRARVFCPDSTIKLDRTQRLAVEHSMKKRISLIEGVAGSGKSLVAASIAYSMKRLRGSKVLLCSPMQATVDKLAKMLAENGRHVNVVKLNSDQQQGKNPCLDGKEYDITADDEDQHRFTSPAANQSGEKYALDTLVNDALYMRRYKRSLESISVPSSTVGKRVFYHSRSHAIAKKQARRFVNIASPWLRRKEELKVLKRADIVCCTLLQAGEAYFRELNFDMLIIDDAHAALEADCVIAMMVKGIKQVTLISDMRRGIRLARASANKNKLSDLDDNSDAAVKSPTLKSKRINSKPYLRLRQTSSSSANKPNGIIPTEPVVTEFKNSELGLVGGLFERWLSMGLSTVVLKYQFRMHETLAALPNYHFYLSKLKTNHETSECLNREIMGDLVLGEKSFTWLPNPKCLTALFVCSKDHKSSVEDTTQEIIDNLILRENVHKSRIGILTNNRADTTIPQAKFEGVCIGTVEDYFGLERDFMILSCKDFISIDNEIIEQEERPIRAEAIRCNFLKSDTALLIALTRARLGLFIVADESICHMESEDSVATSQSLSSESDIKKPKDQSKFCQSWKALVSYYKKNSVINFQKSVNDA